MYYGYSMLVFLGSAALAAVPAAIASKKGYDFGIWWIYAWMLWIVAFIHICLMPNKNRKPPRYERLYSLPRELHMAGMPVLIRRGEMSIDNISGERIVELEIKNLQEVPIRELELSIVAMDEAGISLGAPLTFRYSDLQAKRDEVIGGRTDIRIADRRAMRFSVDLTCVVLANGQLWHGGNEPMGSMPEPVLLKELLVDGELLKQYRLEHGKQCRYVYASSPTLWRCACGALNWQGEKKCHRCGLQPLELQMVDIRALAAHKEQRLQREIRQRKRACLLSVALIAAFALVAVAGHIFLPAEWNSMLWTRRCIDLAAGIGIVGVLIMPMGRGETKSFPDRLKY